MVAVLASGCYATAPIKPSELAQLDGYQDGAPKGGPVSVLSPSNRPVEVGSNSQIFVDLPGGTYGGNFKSIEVRDGVFNGVTKDGQAVQAPLRSIEAARVREPNRGTAALVILGIAAAVATSVIYFALATGGHGVDEAPAAVLERR
ncbi:MAG TPA: hypothetical protein VKZ18_02850 [Polyangia bacterium]|nr:hypothetical protein [Polyangia bacterium]